jgi:IclR family mhp operon transcriptional activator
VRVAGYAFTASARVSRIHGIAVPIRHRQRMLGSLSMRFPRSAMSEEQAAGRYARRLAILARAIANDVVRSRAA